MKTVDEILAEIDLRAGHHAKNQSYIGWQTLTSLKEWILESNSSETLKALEQE